MLVVLGLLVGLSGLTAPVEPVARDTVTVPPEPPPAPQADGLNRTGPSLPPLDPAVGESPLPRWLVPTLLLLLVVGIAVLARYLRRLAREQDDDDPPPPPRHGAASPPPPDLVTAADEGLALLASATDVSDAVVASWVRLEQAAAETGHPRDPAATPSEFTADLLVAGIGREAEVRELLGLYHRARFGSHPLPEGAADRAAACLEAIRSAARTATPEPAPTADGGTP